VITISEAKQRGPLRGHLRTVLPMAERFSVGNEIRVGAVIGKHPVTHVGRNFLQWFGFLMENVPSAEIKSWGLAPTSTVSLSNQSIIESLGGEKTAVTSVVRMVQVIKLGDLGPGHFHGWDNLHYIRRFGTNEICVVAWSLADRGLRFYAFSISDSDGDVWRPGHRVFSG